MKFDSQTITLLLLAGILIIGFNFLKNFLRNLAAKAKKYKRRDFFLTSPELIFYKTLKNLVRDQYAIQCKVRLEDLIEPIAKKNTKDFMSQRGFIRAMHLDFVLCNPETMYFVCAIELDDITHERKNRKEADETKKKALNDAGIHLFRIPTKYKDSRDYIIKTIFNTEEENVTEQKKSQPQNAKKHDQVIDTATTEDNSSVLASISSDNCHKLC